MMKYIDMDNWKRKQHFEHFMNLDYPHFNVCSNVDITEYLKYIKEKEIPFFVSMLYIATRAANEVKEFRYRIREGKVVEHDMVSPSYTIMGEGEEFGFCASDFNMNFGLFREDAEKNMDERKANISLKFDPDADHYLYMTSLPWISFTSMMHPIHLNPVDSVPRIAWGKYFKENEGVKMPFSLQAHHALVDGYHAGKYMEKLQEILNNPKEYLQ